MESHVLRMMNKTLIPVCRPGGSAAQGNSCPSPTRPHPPPCMPGRPTQRRAVGRRGLIKCNVWRGLGSPKGEGCVSPHLARARPGPGPAPAAQLSRLTQRSGGVLRGTQVRGAIIFAELPIFPFYFLFVHSSSAPLGLVMMTPAQNSQVNT